MQALSLHPVDLVGLMLVTVGERQPDWLAAHRQCVAGHEIAERYRFRAGSRGKLPAVAVGSAAGLGVRAGRVSGISGERRWCRRVLTAGLRR